MNNIFLSVSNNADAFRPADVTEFVIDVRNLLIAVLVGFVIAVFGTFYARFIAGRSIRALMAENAYSEETARKLEELGLRFLPYHRHCLEKGYPQRNMVEKTADGRYYIKEECRVRAEKNYGAKENAPVITFSSVIIMLALIAAMWFGTDFMVEKANSLINSIKTPDVATDPTEDETPDGEGETTDGEGEAAEGEGETTDGEGETPDGEGEAADGEGETTDGEGEATDGEGETTDGEGSGEDPFGESDAQE